MLDLDARVPMESLPPSPIYDYFICIYCPPFLRDRWRANTVDFHEKRPEQGTSTTPARAHIAEGGVSGHGYCQIYALERCKSKATPRVQLFSMADKPRRNA